jgi:predicted ester cyclase
MEESIRSIYRLYREVWNQKKLAVIDEIFAAGFKIYASELVIDDKQVLKDFIQSWLISFPDIHHEIDDLIAVGNKVAVRFHGKGTHKGKFLDIPPTNKAFKYTGMNFIYLEEGFIKKLWLNSDMYELANHLKS